MRCDLSRAFLTVAWGPPKSRKAVFGGRPLLDFSGFARDMVCFELYLIDRVIMAKTLANSSGIWLLKSKFFLYRLVSYFTFLLIPVWVQKSPVTPVGIQTLAMSLYILFMVAQWYLMGKEIDHRLKIYFRANSSLDRVVYRIISGMVAIILLFNLLALLPEKWTNNTFWVVWSCLGLFYSWPTRGKIIQESVSSNFSEFRYLDRFEKTLVVLILSLFVFSFPELPSLLNREALMLFFDPFEKSSSVFWNFLTVNFFPFKKYPELFRLGWSLHFYIVGLGLFLLVFYAFLRYFVARRLALLGVFALMSSWSVSKILASNFGSSIETTYSLLWVWCGLWAIKSSTYRSGLLVGLMGFYGTLLNQSQFVMTLVMGAGLYFYFLGEHTTWYRKQFLRYFSLGVLLSFLTLFLEGKSHLFGGQINQSFWMQALGYIDRKAFFTLSFLGLVLVLMKTFKFKWPVLDSLAVQEKRLLYALSALAVLALASFFGDNALFKEMSLLWPLAWLSLFPIEMLFQTLTRLRSKRNMIYLAYILVCLLDSHFEGRVKIFLRLFEN